MPGLNSLHPPLADRLALLGCLLALAALAAEALIPRDVAAFLVHILSGLGRWLA